MVSGVIANLLWSSVGGARKSFVTDPPDALMPIATDFDVDDKMIRHRHHGSLHRYYRIAEGTPVDGLNGTYGDRVRPSCRVPERVAQPTAWVERGQKPPRSRTVPRPGGPDRT